MAEEPVRIVEQKGSHLLARRGARYAILERRNGRIYDVRGLPRNGYPDTEEGIAAAVGPDGWSDEASARAAFAEASARGEQLAQGLR